MNQSEFNSIVISDKSNDNINRNKQQEIIIISRWWSERIRLNEYMYLYVLRVYIVSGAGLLHLSFLERGEFLELGVLTCTEIVKGSGFLLLQAIFTWKIFSRYHSHWNSQYNWTRLNWKANESLSHRPQLLLAMWGRLVEHFVTHLLWRLHPVIAGHLFKHFFSTFNSTNCVIKKKEWL